MGERGPLPKARAHRRGGELLPYLDASPAPEPPSRLGEVAAAVWAEVAAVLAPDGRLTPSDLPLFEVLCCSIADYRAARHLIDAGSVLVLVDGVPAKNPALAVATEAARMITQLGPKFGLSPADRERAKSAVSRPASMADKRLPPSQGGRARRKTGQAPPLRVVAPEAS